MEIIGIDPVIDEFLEGGIESDVVTTVYGPAGSGKSLVAMLAARSVAKKKKVIYIDTEGGFSVERFKQIDPDYKKLLENIMLLKPTTFKEQIDIFSKLQELINEKVGIIVVDSIAMLYRFEIGKCENIQEVNKSLGYQLSLLIDIARKKGIPSILTNHVYADFDNPEAVKLVGGDILKYSCKCLIELKKLNGSRRRASIRKHRSIEENKEVIFEIKKKGISTVSDI
jgi:DNA repair protein RadB